MKAKTLAHRISKYLHSEGFVVSARHLDTDRPGLYSVFVDTEDGVRVGEILCGPGDDEFRFRRDNMGILRRLLR